MVRLFKGAVGPWYSPEKREFHLSRKAARELVTLAIETFKEHTDEKDGTGNKKAPAELFIHGKVRFDDERMGRVSKFRRCVYEPSGCPNPLCEASEALSSG